MMQIKVTRGRITTQHHPAGCHPVGCPSRLCSIGTMVMALTLLLATTMSGVVSAQSAEQMLPGPMSTPELGRYMDRMGLSDQQQLAVEAMHDQYKLAYRELEDSEFAEFSQWMSKIEGSGGFPSRDDVRTMLRMQQNLFGRIRTLDERLFDQIQPLLTEQQLTVLPRVRLSRERQRYMGNEMMWTMGRPPVDVSEMYLQLELDTPTRQATEPLVIDYEHRITRDTARLYKTTSEMFMNIFDELEKAGYTEQMMSDPTQQQEIMQQMQGIFMKVTEDGRKLGWKVHDQNMRLFELLRQTLPAQHAATLRARFYSAAYPQIGWLMQESLIGSMADLEQIPDLTDEQRARLEAEVIAPAAQLDREIDDIAAMIDEMSRAQNPFDFDASQFEEQQKRIGEFQEKAGTFRNGVWKLMSEILSGEQLAAFNVARQQRLATVASNQVIAQASAAAVVHEQELAQTWGPDQFLPAEITSSDVRLYGHMMGLNGDRQTLLNELHNNYMDAYRVYQQDALQRVTNASASLWQYDQDTGVYTPPSADSFKELYDARAATLGRLLAIDNAFFDDVQAAFGDIDDGRAVLRARLMRERDVYNRGHWNTGQGSHAWGIDVIKFTLRLQLTDEEKQAIEPVIRAYEDQAGALCKTKYDAARTWQRANDEWNARAQQMQQDGTFDQNSWQVYQQGIADPTRQLDTANSAIIALNDATITSVLAALSDDHARSLQRTYRRVAFPQVYTDGSSPDAHFDVALGLESLTPEQRSRLEEAALEYRGAYHALNEQLVEQYAQVSSFVGVQMDPEALQNNQRAQERISRAMFDRTEVNSRGIRRLKQILSPDQITQIGGLPRIVD